MNRFLSLQFATPITKQKLELDEEWHAQYHHAVHKKERHSMNAHEDRRWSVASTSSPLTRSLVNMIKMTSRESAEDAALVNLRKKIAFLIPYRRL